MLALTIASGLDASGKETMLRPHALCADEFSDAYSIASTFSQDAQVRDFEQPEDPREMTEILIE